jgi:serine-type D-Ala-D-Ala carboxypeptidase (penicillin-binding protein 5/6)
VQGAGALGQVQGAKSVPVASLVDVLTAYVVLHDHPLAPGADGPSITVNADTVGAYQAGVARQESEVPVTVGETLTELDALEGLLVDSGADMATMLADWDAGSVSAFVAKMNATASTLGMNSTHVTDPSGVDPGTTSTAEDLVGLGEAAIAVPVLRQIVSLGEAQLPSAPLVYNLNFALGRDGIIGIKTGSDAAAGGGYLFAAQQAVGQKQVTVVGAVLGQSGVDGPNTAAVDAGDALVKAALSSVREVVLFPAGQAVGNLTAPWGASAMVTAAATVSVVGWPGLTIPLASRLYAVKAPVAADSVVGVLRAGSGGTRVSIWLRTQGTLSGPTTWWRLTRR